ncbi:hypothetical protein [Nocardia sp. NPDC057227]|uniref:hypothetical protein n=1 Tax=Nocardia sp. NPDC057227 TaxID=3346056 RepID=UPI0036336155
MSTPADLNADFTAGNWFVQDVKQVMDLFAVMVGAPEGHYDPQIEDVREYGQDYVLARARAELEAL